MALWMVSCLYLALHWTLLYRLSSSSRTLLRRSVVPPPRVYYLEGTPPGGGFVPVPSVRILDVNETSGASVNDSDDSSNSNNETCVPLADWYNDLHPDCNRLHELDLTTSLVDEDLDVLGRGWFRVTFRYQNVVLKVLRTEREFLREYYELHRRDALALERLTTSPFVVNVYGYCGQSTINEFADFTLAPSLEDLNKKLRDRIDERTLLWKLKLAASVAQGVADVHQAGDKDATRAHMVHYDLNPRNVALFGPSAQPKLNDFNIAEFLRYDPTTNATCGFASRMHDPWWRAPEEVGKDGVPLDEKVDLYALGNVLFAIFTTHAPRGKMKDVRKEDVRVKVQEGQRPLFPKPWDTMEHPVAQVLREAIHMCLEPKPQDRPTADHVAGLLSGALQDLVAAHASEEV